MLIHSHAIKCPVCGNTDTRGENRCDLDTDDFIACWMIHCFLCGTESTKTYKSAEACVADFNAGKVTNATNKT